MIKRILRETNFKKSGERYENIIFNNKRILENGHLRNFRHHWYELNYILENEDDKLYVQHQEGREIEEGLIVTVKLSGIRRGSTERFPVFTDRQMEANNKFWNSALE